MYNFTEIDGDILDIDIQYIAHQCNCCSQKTAGLARQIFDKFPWSDVTVLDTETRRLGNIFIAGDGYDKRYVIDMFAQYYPGRSYPDGKDSENERKKNFLLCLKKISGIKNMKSIAFPNGIGCGLAGGDWDWYKYAINIFANEIRDIDVEVFIVRNEHVR